MANIKISQLITGIPGTSSVFPYSDNGSTYKGFVSGLTTNYVEVTKNELDSLIITSSLIPGYFYIISGVDTDLYNGTTIILESVSTNKLDNRGVGLFYNPKYDQTTDGYGIWNKYITPNFDSISGGVFIYEETVTNDLGGTATYLSDEFLDWVSGDWTGAVTITGNSSGTIATISNALTPNYNSGDTVTWGGLVWESTGLVGDSTGKYSLSSDWNLIPFDEVYYNLVADEVVYDYDKDKIILRKDKYGNEVSCTYQSISKFEINGFGNPIRDFQWGNNQTNWGVTPGLFLFNDVPATSYDINIGGEDMYDVGNILNTDLSTQIPYTHTQMTQPPVNENNSAPINSFAQDGVVSSGDSYFGSGSEYFTNLYPGLFVMAADNTSIDNFFIDGNLGTDCDSTLDSYEMVYERPSGNYKAFVKRFYDNVNLEPSNNHIFIVNSELLTITHDYNSGGCDSDYHEISNLLSAGVSKVYYILMSLYPNQKIDDASIDEIVNSFLYLVEDKSLQDALTSLNSSYSSITSQFGQSQTLNQYGVMGNKITDSYFDCINFMGGSLWNNSVTQNCAISNNLFAPVRNNYFSFNNFNFEAVFSGNTFSPRFGFESNTVSYSYINDNIFGDYSNFDSYLKNCQLNYCDFLSNSFHNSPFENTDFENGSSLSNNVFNDTYVALNHIGKDCSVLSNTLLSSQMLQNKLDNDSSVFNNDLSYSEISYNTLNSSSIVSNILYNNCAVISNSLDKSSSIINNYFSDNTFLRYNTLNQNSIIDSNSGLTNSYIEYNNLFYGKFLNNYLNNSCFITENSLTNYSEISENTMSGSSFISNNVIENGSYILTNTVNGGTEVILNNLSTGYIYQNTLSSTSLSRNLLSNESEIYLNSLTSSFLWKNVLSSESTIYNGIFSSSTFGQNYLKNSDINFESSCLINSKSLISTNFVDSEVTDISENSNTIFDSFSKNVFTNSSGVTRISYYDGSDTLIIGNINDSVVPTLNITGWTAISSYNIDVYVDITSDGGNSVTQRGVVWDTSPYPTVSDNVVVKGGTGTGLYTTSITGLTASSTIYFRGYAVNSSGTGYTCQDSYITP